MRTCVRSRFVIALHRSPTHFRGNVDSGIPPGRLIVVRSSTQPTSMVSDSLFGPLVIQAEAASCNAGLKNHREGGCLTLR